MTPTRPPWTNRLRSGVSASLISVSTWIAMSLRVPPKIEFHRQARAIYAVARVGAGNDGSHRCGAQPKIWRAFQRLGDFPSVETRKALVNPRRPRIGVPHRFPIRLK